MDSSELVAKLTCSRLPLPVRRDGKIYASDGAMAVAIDDNPSIECGADDHGITVVMIRQILHPTKEYLPLPDMTIPDVEKCKTCDGTGKVHDCPDCPALEHPDQAFFECREHCNTCGDAEYLPGDGAGASDCPGCHGCGTSARLEIVELGRAYISAFYAEILNGLSDVEITSGGPTNVINFRFAGGRGAVMPIRKYP